MTSFPHKPANQDTRENRYRTHFCGEPTLNEEGGTLRVAGWIHNKRDHGGLLFVDLRDGTGILQCVVQESSDAFAALDKLSLESVVQIEGEVVRRTPATVNKDLATGEVELVVSHVLPLSIAEILPLQVNTEEDFPEETRLKYRFLDLRRARVRKNIELRSRVIQRLRELMQAQNFLEVQTPILTSSSPEGARDFLVPPRLSPGHCYALPQAPQQFKQLLIAGGVDRYFQIAPCFRDEDARRDRSPGEFYQLDFEMAFVRQEDVFEAIEPVLHTVFSEFGRGASLTKPSFPRIPYEKAMLHYGSDKPDLRNPLKIEEGASLFEGSGFDVFLKAIEKGSVVRVLKAPGAASKSRKFFDELTKELQKEGAGGLAYIVFGPEGMKGPLAKFFKEDEGVGLKRETGASPGDVLFFICDEVQKAARLSGKLRELLGEGLGLIEQNAFRFCWVTDFPMYERDPITKKIIFSHNPFSMPQGGMQTLETVNPLSIKAYQYDIVVNGIELSSGAIRNHLPEVMIKAFEIAGYGPEHVEEQFGALFRAFKFGVPPHGGAAPGIDRILMLLAGEENLREIIAFPLNQKAQDPLMGAPSEISDDRLRELFLKKMPQPLS